MVKKYEKDYFYIAESDNLSEINDNNDIVSDSIVTDIDEDVDTFESMSEEEIDNEEEGELLDYNEAEIDYDDEDIEENYVIRDYYDSEKYLEMKGRNEINDGDILISLYLGNINIHLPFLIN